MCRKLLQIYKNSNGRRLSENLYVIFINSYKSGPVVQVAIPKHRSITAHVYKKYVLKKVKKHFNRKRSKYGIRNIRLLHDNALIHQSQTVRSFLEEKSSFFAPSSAFSQLYFMRLFFFFQNEKKNLSGRRYASNASRNALGYVLCQYMSIIPKKT